MPKEFTHLVLTRFNTILSFAPPPQRLQRDWIEQRLVPFEQYCLPSLAAQRDVEFTWLMFMDAASPEWLKEKMRSYEPLVVPVWINGPLTDDVIASSISGTGLVRTPYLITTRIDSDDAFASNHLALVQSAFERQERQFLDFPLGFESYRGHLYNCYWPSNSFISLIEKVQNDNRFTTVHCVRHDHVYQTGLVKSCWRSAQWVHVIHTWNSLSSLRSLPRVRSKSHPSFEVWPQPEFADSLAARTRFSAEHFATIGVRVIKRKTTGATKWASQA